MHFLNLIENVLEAVNAFYTKKQANKNLILFDIRHRVNSFFNNYLVRLNADGISVNEYDIDTARAFLAYAIERLEIESAENICTMKSKNYNLKGLDFYGK